MAFLKAVLPMRPGEWEIACVGVCPACRDLLPPCPARQHCRAATARARAPRIVPRALRALSLFLSPALLLCAYVSLPLVLSSYMPPVCHVFNDASIPLILDTLWHD